MIWERLASDENSEVGTFLAWGLDGGFWGQNRNARRGRPVRKTTAGQLSDPKQTVAASWSASSWENGGGNVAPLSWVAIRSEQVDVPEVSGTWEKLGD